MLPCPLTKNPAFEGEGVLIFEVVPPQSELQALVHSVGFRIALGDLPAAARLQPALERLPDSLPALIALGRLHWQQQHPERLPSVLRPVAQLADQIPGLALEDHVYLATLFAAAGNQARARQEISACWTKAEADEGALRKLPPDALLYLLSGSQQLQIDPPPRVIALAEQLLPPGQFREPSRAGAGK